MVSQLHLHPFFPPPVTLCHRGDGPRLALPPDRMDRAHLDSWLTIGSGGTSPALHTQIPLDKVEVKARRTAPAAKRGGFVQPRRGGQGSRFRSPGRGGQKVAGGRATRNPRIAGPSHDRAPAGAPEAVACHTPPLTRETVHRMPPLCVGFWCPSRARISRRTFYPGVPPFGIPPPATIFASLRDSGAPVGVTETSANSLPNFEFSFPVCPAGFMCKG